MTSTTLDRSARQHRGLSRFVAWTLGSVWVADLLLIALFGFFIAIGALDPLGSSGLAVTLAGLIGISLAYAWVLHRRREEIALTPERRRARERRGY